MSSNTDHVPMTLFGLPVVVTDEMPLPEPPKLGVYRTRWPLRFKRNVDGSLYQNAAGHFVAETPEGAGFIDSNPC